MINKTEKEIITNWQGSIDAPEVSIVCLSYNHEEFIDKALDSFLLQETSFPFEIVIHDDASTDSTKSIIEKYHLEYPKIIKPIYEQFNLYSKHDGSIRKNICESCKGKYIALCEGDDRWSDEKKLQLQYNELENNKNAVLCVHNTMIHNLDSDCKDTKFNKWNEYKIMSPEDVFFGWNVHTSSYFIRSSIYKVIRDFPQINNYWFGDYIYLTISLYFGDIIYLPKIMSIYNKNNKNGVTYINSNSSLEELVKKELMRVDYIHKYNKYTSNKFIIYTQKITSQAIEEIEFKCMLYKGMYKEMMHNIKYRNILKSSSLSFKIRLFLKCYFPHVYSLLKNMRQI